MGEYMERPSFWPRSTTARAPPLSGLFGRWTVSRDVIDQIAEGIASVLPRPRNYRMEFLDTVRKGDILISSGSKSSKGIVGHAAIMATNDWIVEMPGGAFDNLEDNNRRVACDDWWDERPKEWISMYRCPDHNIANWAADWAYTRYYNSEGGDRKTIHVKYSVVAPLIESTDPSYCSKLVIQSYHLGSGSESVIDLSSWCGPLLEGSAIVPTKIPSYFLPPYTLEYKGRF